MVTDRRRILSGLSATLATGLVSSAHAASHEANPSLEADKEKIVNDFCRDWATRDANTLLSYLDLEIEYHMFEGAPPINGHAAFSEQLGPFLDDMREVRWDILRSSVMGDVVLNERIDYFFRKEGSQAPDNEFHVVGVFLIRDGKIKYWKDYGLSGAL